MDFLIVLLSLCLLMFVAYRGFSVILFAPIAAMLAVLLTQPDAVPSMFTGIFMEKLAGFVRLYFPVFLLGAVFGKVIEISGFSKTIVRAVIGVVGVQRAMLSIVLVCAILTYGGVSLFVVVFAVYPFAAEMFRSSDIPKRLIPGTVALGAFSFTMDALPGTPQIQNIIPSTFFGTTTWAAPVLGVLGSVFIFVLGMAYLEFRRRTAKAQGEGYGTGHVNEPEPLSEENLPNPWVAILPLIVVGVMNKVLTSAIPIVFGTTQKVQLVGHEPLITQIGPVTAIWAVMGALILGILTVLAFAWKAVAAKFAEGTKAAVAGSLLASMNTASEYGFGGVIASLPGFLVIAGMLQAIPNPLVKIGVTVSALAGITGSASGGLSIALAAMSGQFKEAAAAANIPLEVVHRVAAMASGGMDTLPHNGAVITLLFVTGLSHRQSYGDIFAITVLKTLAVLFVILVYYTTGIV